MLCASDDLRYVISPADSLWPSALRPWPAKVNAKRFAFVRLTMGDFVLDSMVGVDILGRCDIISMQVILR